MQDFELIASARTEMGKGAVRRLRRTGRVPAVLYGGDKEPESVHVDAHHLRKQLENEAFFAHIITVKVDGRSTQAVVKAMQRDPASYLVTHVDLLRVSSTHEITMNVPLHFMNEETAPGKKQGGVVSHLLVDVEISCLPKDLPEFIEVDIGALDIGDSVHLSEVKVPEGVRLLGLGHDDDEQDQVIVSINHPQAMEVEDEELDEVAEEPADDEPEAESED